MKSLLENFTGGKKQYEELKDNQKILLTKAVHDDLRKSENFGDLNLLRTANSINENKIGLRQENKDQYKNTLSKMDQIIFDHSEELVNLKSDFDTNPNSYQMSSHQANVMQKFYSRLNKITKEKTNHRSRNLDYFHPADLPHITNLGSHKTASVPAHLTGRQLIERTLRKGKRPTDYNPEKAGLKKIEELKDLGGNWAELELKLNYLKKSQDSLNLTKGFSDYGNMNPRRYEYYSKKIEYYKHVLESFIYNVHLTHSPKDLRIILKARKAKLDNTPSSAPRSPKLLSHVTERIGTRSMTRHTGG